MREGGEVHEALQLRFERRHVRSKIRNLGVHHGVCGGHDVGGDVSDLRLEEVEFASEFYDARIRGD